MRRTASLLAQFAALAITAKANATITVDYIAQPGQRSVADAGGDAIADGNSVWIGTFSPGFEDSIGTTAASLQDLLPFWTIFHTTKIRTLAGEPGRFAESGSADGADFSSKKIYTWIFQTLDNGAPAADFGNVVSHGIFSSTLTIWKFPFENAFPPFNSTLIDSNQVDESFGSAKIEMNQLLLSAIASAGLTYSAWQTAVFPPETASSDRMKDADPDLDGLINLFEYYYGLPPLQRSCHPVTITGRKPQISIQFPRARNLPAGIGILEASSDAVEWTVLNKRADSVTAVDEGTETVRFDFDVAPELKTLYFRVRIDRAIAN